ncbi:hypothetical protein BLGI_4890 [Brevibacillus laterosporus GI-9]|nr:hypothetical protein BLGI_4890 [Brevibacillus laterosporus GI-9]
MVRQIEKNVNAYRQKRKLFDLPSLLNQTAFVPFNESLPS